MNLEDIKTQEPSEIQKFYARLAIAKKARNLDEEWAMLMVLGLTE